MMPLQGKAAAVSKQTGAQEEADKEEEEPEEQDEDGEEGDEEEEEVMYCQSALTQNHVT